MRAASELIPRGFRPLMFSSRALGRRGPNPSVIGFASIRIIRFRTYLVETILQISLRDFCRNHVWLSQSDNATFPIPTCRLSWNAKGYSTLARKWVFSSKWDNFSNFLHKLKVREMGLSENGSFGRPRRKWDFDQLERKFCNLWKQGFVTLEKKMGFVTLKTYTSSFV